MYVLHISMSLFIVAKLLIGRSLACGCKTLVLTVPIFSQFGDAYQRNYPFIIPIDVED